MVQGLFHTARRGCAGIGGKRLGRRLDDVVNGYESSSGRTNGLACTRAIRPAPINAIPIILSSVVKSAETEVFYFHEFLDAVVGTFTTEP